MPIVGGLDIHRKQITFDYLDTATGEVRRGQIAPADRAHLRAWLARFAGRDDVAFALEGCTGWRYVAEELAAAGVTAHVAEPAGTAFARGRKRHAKTDPDPDGTGLWAQVRRLLSCDPATGRRGWSEPFRLARPYLRSDVHLGYAVTIHSAPGQTRGTGHAVFTGEEDLEALYPAITRGADANYGYFFTTDPLAADPQPGTRPAAELARQRMLDRERQGLPGQEAGAEPAGEVTAAAVAARIMERDGQELSATEIRAAELADIDRLDLLYSQWETVTRAAAQREYESAVARVLPAAHAAQVVSDPAAAALWRGLREAQAAGLDPERLHPRHPPPNVPHRQQNTQRNQAKAPPRLTLKTP